MEDVVKDKKGRIIFLTPEKFRKKIILRDRCFVCGASQKESSFNNEHIFPKWMLNDFAMHNMFIDLSNNTKHKYGTYTVPCCVDCNSRMGNEIENPLSKVLRSGHGSVCDYLSQNNHTTLYFWLARIFLKTHLKDKSLRQFVDLRKKRSNIGDNYKWEGFYIPFLFSRAFYAKTNFDENMMGTFLIFPVVDNKNNLSKRWMYVDDTNTLTLLLQIRDVGFIASFGDFGIASCCMKKMFDKIGKRPVNPSQLAELAAHVSAINATYKNRPNIFYNHKDNVFASSPPAKTRTEKIKKEEWGKIMHHFTHKLVSSNDANIIREIKAGIRTFLWNKDGTFNTSHLDG